MKSRRFALVTALMFTAAAPLLAQSSAHRAAPARAATSPASAGSRFLPWGVDLSARDMAVKPGDDFFHFANGAWFRANPIPADRTGWGVGAQLSEDVEGQLREIVQSANRGTDPVSRQVAAMYASWMDVDGIEARGAAVLRPYLDRINAAQNRDDLIRLFAEPGYPSPVGVGITPNPADPTHYVAGAGQGGLGMPNRTYYLNEGAQFDTYRAAYRTYVVTMLRLAGIDNPETKADAIIALERRIAEAHWTPERSRDVSQSINPMTPAQLQELAPQFNWPLMLSSQGLGSVPTIIVRQTTAIQAEGRLFAETDLQTWKDWLTFHFIRSNAQFLPRAFDEANFAFYSRTLGGVQQQRERWKRGLGVLNGALGEAVGQIYVQRHFPESSRRQMTELVGDLRAALGERLRANAWMDQETRTAALAKLDAFDPRIGNPVRFIDYSSMRVDPADLLGNMQRAAEFQRNLALSRLPNPVDRSLWAMTPQTINAYYSPLTNQITFPAAILQPPYFNPQADPAVNYGAIGAVIGHEIGHGFDDQGSRFDPQGRLRNWWSPASNERFRALTTRLGAQYNSYVSAGQHVNGQLTMGENIGDLGGIEMAYAAYQRYQARHGRARVIGGLTGDQRFFLAYAQAWRRNDRDDALRQQVLTDPHSPAEWRVNGVVRNVDAWYRAFNVRPGDRLYLAPADRVHIW
ncbi:M13 family metallopeptidase [Allosphingosinicella sp.]|uniref:M13 family metallopeptidase n=1 Tax=Allosphingosinicella sp. TaxID=2823234 RepID=UPI003783D474